MMLFALAVLAGCEVSTQLSPDPQLRFRAARDVFRADSIVEIPFSIENTSDSTVFLLWCGENVHLNVDYLVDGKWSEALISCQGSHDLGPRALAPRSAVSGTHSWSRPGSFRLKAFVTDSAGKHLREVHSQKLMI